MTARQPTTAAAKQAMLEQATVAALGGHDLAAFEIVDDSGYQARCRSCGQTVWVGWRGVVYSLLADTCAKEIPF